VLLDEIINEGKDAATFLLNLIEHFRNLMIAKIARADSHLIDLPKETCEKLWQQSQYFGLEEIFSSFNILVNTQEVAKRLDSLRIPLEIALVRLAHNKKETVSSKAQEKNPQVVEHAAVKEDSSLGKVKQEKNITPSVDKTPPSESDKDEPVAEKIDCSVGISLDNIKEAWAGIIEGLGRIKMSVATYLSEGSPARLENNILTVIFPVNYSLHKESLESKENRGIIEEKIKELLHAKLRVNFMLSKDMPQKGSALESPYIKSILSTFHGRLIKED